MANRKAAEEFILKYIEKVIPGGYSTKYYKYKFSKMSDKDFDSFMVDLRDGKASLVLYAPNFKSTVKLDRNIAIGKELGHSFFKKLWIGKHNDMPTYLTLNEYLIMDIPVRRASQLLTKKIKIPEHNKTVDNLTGQPTGASKGSRVSYEEIKVLSTMGLDNCIVELMKYRGGDSKGYNAMNSMISRFGVVNMKNLEQFASGVESTRTFSTFLTAMHLKNNL